MYKKKNNKKDIKDDFSAHSSHGPGSRVENINSLYKYSENLPQNGHRGL